MKTLTLIRHATAAPGADDLNRALTPKGREEATDIARQLALLRHYPRLILASPARRTAETAALIMSELGHEQAFETDNALYNASAETIFDRVWPFFAVHDHLAVVGHNPGIGQLAFDLGGVVHPAIARGFEPATVAVFEWNTHDCADVTPSSARLRQALTPNP